MDFEGSLFRDGCMGIAHHGEEGDTESHPSNYTVVGGKNIAAEPIAIFHFRCISSLFTG